MTDRDGRLTEAAMSSQLQHDNLKLICLSQESPSLARKQAQPALLTHTAHERSPPLEDAVKQGMDK